MALLKVTQNAIDQAKTPDEGWYELEITKIEDELSKPDPKQPHKKQNLNAWATFLFTRNLQDGSDMEHMQKTKRKYVMTYAYFAMASDFLCAAFDIPSLEVLIDKDIDAKEALVGRKIFAHVKHDVYQGKPTWDFDQFSPTSRLPF